MKDLQPAMREDTRYLKFRIHSDQERSISEVVEAFWSTAISYMGTKDLSKAQPWFIANKFDEEKQEGVIKVNKEYVAELRAALILVDAFGQDKSFLTVEKISGSVSSL